MAKSKLSDLPSDMRAELLEDVREQLLSEAAEQIGLPNVAAAVKKIANLREHILTKSTLPEERVHVADWDTDEMECWILVRALTARERAQFMKQVTAPTAGQAQQMGQAVNLNWERYVADIVIMTARDPETGELLFVPTDRDGLLAVAAKPVEKLATVARRLSGLEEDASANAQFSD